WPPTPDRVGGGARAPPGDSEWMSRSSRRMKPMDDRTGDWVSVSELEGAYVHRVMLQASGDFVLDVSREKPMSGEIRLEQIFRLRDRDGVTTEHDPRHPAQLGPALELAGQTVVSVSYSKRGELDVEFADGLHLFASS